MPYMGGEGRDRRYITASKGMGSRYLMVERSGQSLEFVKKKKQYQPKNTLTRLNIEFAFSPSVTYSKRGLEVAGRCSPLYLFKTMGSPSPLPPPPPPWCCKPIFTPLALVYAFLCFMVSGISWKRKQKKNDRVLRCSSSQKPLKWSTEGAILQG